MRSIWQNQLAHHLTELTLRLNQQGPLGITTRLRIKEGQLQSKYLCSPLSSNCKFNKPVPEHNLVVKVLHEAAKLDIRINEIAEDSDTLNIKGTEISSLLDIKELRSYKNLDNMNFFILEQLLDSTGSHLLT